MDIFLLQLALIFLPGLIWARLDARYGMKTKPSDTEFLIRSFMYGLVSYAVVYLIYKLLGWPFSEISDSVNGQQSLVIPTFSDEILMSIPVSVALGILWVTAATRKWLTRLLQKFGVTNKYGDEDVWDFTFSANSSQSRYVHFRDFDKTLVYAGYVQTFSETGNLREMVLEDVRIYDFAGKEVAVTPLLYLAREPSNIHIEFPVMDSGAGG